MTQAFTRHASGQRREHSKALESIVRVVVVVQDKLSTRLNNSPVRLPASVTHTNLPPRPPRRHRRPPRHPTSDLGLKASPSDDQDALRIAGRKNLELPIRVAQSWLQLPADHHAVAQRARSNLFTLVVAYLPPSPLVRRAHRTSPLRALLNELTIPPVPGGFGERCPPCTES